MAGPETDFEGKPTETISIHFDVPGHEIPLHTFVRTAEQTVAVMQAFNRELFEGQLQYKIVVLPPDDGSFLTKLGVVLLAGWGVVWTFTESDIGQAFIKGLTTHEPAYWAEKIGTEIRAQHLNPNSAETPDDADSKSFQCQYAALVLVETATAFLQKSTSDLAKVGVTPTKFKAAYEARNEFYLACVETEGLSAIGFSEAPVFPISRSDFSSMLVALTPKDEEVEEPWLTATFSLKVTSPNWDRDDRQRQWKGKDGKGRERYFRIEDEYFWGLVKGEKLNPHIIDTIKVQWAFHGTGENPKSCRVLKVLEYNGMILSAPFDDNALASILGPYQEIENDQPDLFGGNG